jgi:acyl dehydratase
MATAELAVAMPALVLVLALVVGAVSLGIDQVRCVDAARAGARLAARGESSSVIASQVGRAAPEEATVRVAREGDRVVVTVAALPHPLLRRLGVGLAPSATATALHEDTLAGLPP